VVVVKKHDVAGPHEFNHLGRTRCRVGFAPTLPIAAVQRPIHAAQTVPTSREPQGWRQLPQWRAEQPRTGDVFLTVGHVREGRRAITPARNGVRERVIAEKVPGSRDLRHEASTRDPFPDQEERSS